MVHVSIGVVGQAGGNLLAALHGGLVELVVAVGGHEEVRPSARLIGGGVAGLGNEAVRVERGEVAPLVLPVVPVIVRDRVAHEEALHVDARGAILEVLQEDCCKLRAVMACVALAWALASGAEE